MVSLVKTSEDTVKFVWWYNWSNKVAREMYIDDENRQITILPPRNPLIDMSTAHIILQDTGMRNERISKARTLGRLGRSEVPPWLLVLQRFEQTQLFAGAIPRDPHGHCKPYRVNCVLCDVAHDHGLSGQREFNEDRFDVFFCVSCMSPWHVSCADAFSTRPTEMAPAYAFKCPVCRGAA